MYMIKINTSQKCSCSYFIGRKQSLGHSPQILPHLDFHSLCPHSPQAGSLRSARFTLEGNDQLCRMLPLTVVLKHQAQPNVTVSLNAGFRNGSSSTFPWTSEPDNGGSNDGKQKSGVRRVKGGSEKRNKQRSLERNIH